MDNNNTMEYRIGLEKQNKRNDQVTELILDNCRASQISGLTDEFINLETLSLINVGLVTLKGFPKLPKLKKLELSDNRLTGGLNLLHGSPKLQHLNISGNRIKDLEALEPLKEFHELVNLDLYNCEVTKSEDYRQKVFDLLPNLNSLDGYDRDEKEVADSDESEDEGSDVENRITREDNDLDDDDDDDDEEGDNSESDYDEEDYMEGGMDTNYNDEEVGDEDDIDDDEDEDGDEIDEEDDNEEYAIEGSGAEGAPTGNVENGDNEIGLVGEDGEIIEDDGEDDDDDDDEEGDGSDLKQLQKDLAEDEDSDDDDFEPTHEPDARDFEIDPEDDADEDETSAILSTSNIEAGAGSTEVGESKQRGEKRKHEDEGGDESNKEVDEN